MRGGRPAWRILLAMALVALPLVGLAVLRDGGVPAVPASVRESVLRVAPGQGSDAQAVRPGTDVESGARSAPGAREVGLLAVLLAAAGALARAARSGAGRPALAAVPTGRHRPAAGRGPPSAFQR